MKNEKNVKATSAWLQMAQRTGLITYKSKENHLPRPQVERGVSIDWLAQFAASIRAQPSLSTNTCDIVDTLIHAATSERRCALVDLVPAQHAGHATMIICHAWKSDLLGLIMALVDDFNTRWEAHKAYRNQHKTAAQLLAEEHAAMHKQQEVARMQQQLEAMLVSTDAAPQWDPGSRPSTMHAMASFKPPAAHKPGGLHGTHEDREGSRKFPGCTASTMGTAGTMAQDAGVAGVQARHARASMLGQDAGRLSRKPRMSSVVDERSVTSPAAGPWQAARQATTAVATAAAAAAAAAGKVPSPEGVSPRDNGIVAPASQQQKQVLSHLLVQPTISQPSLSALALDPTLKRRLRKQSTTLMQRVGPARPSTTPAKLHDGSKNNLYSADQEADAARTFATPNCATTADEEPAFNTSQSHVRRVMISNGALSSLVDAVRQDHAAQKLANVALSPTKDIRSATKKLLLAKRALGQGPGMNQAGSMRSLNHLPSISAAYLDADTEPAPTRPCNMLARCGTLHRVCSIGPHAELNRLDPMQDIYSRATASMDFTHLLRPVDEASELLDAVARAQRAVARKQAAVHTSKDEEVLQDEKKKLMGYYVWIDIFALEQAALQAQAEPDLVSMSRLINMVGHTVVIVDEEWSCLQRLWCIFEMWCTIRFKAALTTLSTPAAVLAAQGAGRSLRAGELEQLLSPLQRANSPSSPLGAQLSTRPSTTVSLTLSSPLAGSSPPGSPQRRSLAELEGLDSFNQNEGGLLPVPESISVLDARTSRSEDHVAILGALGDELASVCNKTYSLHHVSTRLREALLAAREREAAAPQLTKSVCAALAACSRNWTDIMTVNWRHLDAARRALKTLCEDHLAEQFKAAKDVKAAVDEDVELELWQLTRFVAAQLAAQKAEPLWVAEFKRYSNMVNRAFATRFSERYVNQLLKAAGTFDNMKVLRSYVYTQCHTRMQYQRQDDGE